MPNLVLCSLCFINYCIVVLHLMRNKVHNYICNRLTDFVVDPEHMLLYRRCSG